MTMLVLFSPQIYKVTAATCIWLYEKERHPGYRK